MGAGTGDALTREEAIETNPSVCGGQPVFRGTRVPICTVLASLAEGDTVEQVRQNFPTLTAEHLLVAIELARR